MIRLTGLLALLAASVLTTVLLMRVSSLRAIGTVEYATAQFPACLHLDLKTATRNKVASENSSYRGSGYFYYLVYDLDPEIPDKAAVTVTIRQIPLPNDLFESVDVEYGGRSFPCGRSSRVFFLWLAFVGSTPLLLWTLLAIPAWFIRTKTKSLG